MNTLSTKYGKSKDINFVTESGVHALTFALSFTDLNSIKVVIVALTTTIDELFTLS